MKKLLYVTHGLNIGGTEFIVSRLTKYFKDTYQVGILVLDKKGELWEELETLGVELYFLDRKPGWRLCNFFKFFKFLRKFKPDIVHAHQYTPFFFTAIYKLIYLESFYLIFTEHGRHYPDYVSAKRRFANKIFSLALDSATAVCEFTKRALVNHEGIEEEKIQVIYNGVELDQSEAPSIRDKYNIPQESFLIGYVGSFRPVKNPLLLLEVFNLLSKTKKNVHLIFIGDGELRTELEEKVKKYSLEEKVTFTGNIMPAGPYIKQLDLFVQPSLSEAHSLALIEAQGYGVPAVVTNVGGQPEVIQDGVNGFLAKNQDAQDLTKKIESVINDQELWKSMSKKAVSLFKENYTEDKMFSAYSLFYEK